MHPVTRGAPGLPRTVVTASREAAASILADVRRGILLDAAFDRRAATLDARDRRWLQELVFGVLRRRALIDARLDQRVRGGLSPVDPAIVDLLRLGTYQLLHMDSVPPWAAIGQTVEQAKSQSGQGAAGLVNAVLRRVDRERGDLPLVQGTPIEQLALEFSHPPWMIARWVARWGVDETRALVESNNSEAPVVLRPFGVTREEFVSLLLADGVEAADVPLAPDGVRIRGVAPGTLAVVREGRAFVQDPAATLVIRYADVAPGSLVVDLCAAPGGKAIEVSRVAGRVIACDRSDARAARLRENVSRLRVANIDVVVADARAWPGGSPPEPGDVVLLDAPCTGTGTFRRHPDARWRLKVSDLAVLASAQRGLLAAAAQCVAPGGVLVYSTCSLEPEENDDQVELFLREHREWALEPPAPGTVPPDVLDAGLLRVLPQRHGVDGAFAARFRRRAKEESA